MKQRNSHLQPLALAALLGALSMAGSARAQLTDISNAPMSSSSSLQVLPNLLFTLDDSGSMAEDYNPDNTGALSWDDWTQNFMCKTNSTGNNFCNRTDPPFYANSVNGMAYDPSVTYRPAVKYDGTSFPNQTPTSAQCDPFNGQTCYTMYQNVMGDVYNTGNNPAGNWFGTGSTVDVTTRWPEVVYCLSSGSDVNNLDQCRRNGLDNSSDPRNTGVSFRYTTAGYRTGYPETFAVHEFWRPNTGSTVTVTSAFPHGYTCGSYPCTTPNTISPGTPYPDLSTFAVVPRNTGSGSSGSGFENSGSSVAITRVLSTNQFTYTRNSGQRLAFGSYDMVVAFKNGSGGTRTTVYVTAPGHGLIAGDKIQVFISNANIACSNGATVTVLASPAPTADTFAYTNSCATSNNISATGIFRKTSLYNYPKLRYGSAIVYTLGAVDYCKDDSLTDCQTGSSGAYTIPAPVRYCLDPFDAGRLDTPTGKDRTGVYNRCQRKYNATAGYIYARYGTFTRTDVTSGGSYGGRALRTDCAARPTCSGTEEVQNFANWFSYYRTRMLTMKTSAGLSFSTIDSRYRVGFITINPGNPVGSNKYLAIDKFDPTQKQAWYTKFYAQEPGASTPLRVALSRAGRHFAGKTDGINQGMPEDPVEYSCQQNFLLLTTDGYWNGGGGQRVDGSGMGNTDNNVSATPRPSFDGGTPYNPKPSDSGYSSSNTLADAAQYYWQTDLRPAGSTGALGLDVSQDNVPNSTKDPATWQHMVTFGLGLADGLMLWRPDYESAATGDFASVQAGGGTCPWDNNRCDWPMPHADNPAAIDDLWHAAVNGHGTYFNARDPVALQDGLNSALTNLQQRNASSAAAATSTPTITTSDRTIFLSTYTTVQWNGEIVARLIDPNTGVILPGNLWSASSKVQGRVSASSDSRKIYTFDASSRVLKDFTWANMSTALEQSWYQNKCTPTSNMTQCSLLDPATDLIKANDGNNMVNFLRGQTGLEATVYRDRQLALGDTVNSIPLYVSRPRLAFNDGVTPDYATWANSLYYRTPTLYVGANDGMLHAFNANTGDEAWAYIPRIVAPNLWKLAEENYATKHMYFVDGSPSSMDVYDSGAGTWRTILVGGLNSGGRGYYALDITNPAAPIALWEFCSDTTLCPVPGNSDPDMGLSYGNPVITKRASDGRWVVLVTSGYNNVTPGNGQGYLYVLDALTGQMLNKIGTGVGGTCVSSCVPFAGPSGLARIAAWADNYVVDNTTKWVYGGDLFGNMWKFDLTASTPTVKLLGLARDGSNRPQPITTAPVLGQIQNLYQVIAFGTGRYLGQSDLSDPATQSPPGTTAWQQSVYAFKDTDTNLGNLRLSGLVNQPLVGLAGGTTRSTSGACTATACGNPVNWGNASAGWYFDLNPGNSSPGERVNIDPQLALGTLLVIGNVPGSSACSVGGDAWLYQIDFKTGGTVVSTPGQTIATKMTGALGVGQTSFQLPGGALRNVVIRSDGSTPTPNATNTAPNSENSRRASWREMTQ
jgi:type IV pilus assembly protein PilY1